MSVFALGLFLRPLRLLPARAAAAAHLVVAPIAAVIAVLIAALIAALIAVVTAALIAVVTAVPVERLRFRLSCIITILLGLVIALQLIVVRGTWENVIVIGMKITSLIHSMDSKYTSVMIMPP